MSGETKPVWFITGCSSGLGRAIAHHVLSLGHLAVVTARKPAELQDFLIEFSANALALELDVTRQESIDAAVSAATKRFGRIDVLVNNAGLTHLGLFEESDLAPVRKLFETNVWGLVAMTRAVLPTMRRQRTGTIVNVSSIAGLSGAPVAGYYSASKFAVEGLSEALAQEVAPLGLKVVIVEPGVFRTGILTGPVAALAASLAASQTGDDYRAIVDSTVSQLGSAGMAAGDPARLAEAVVKAVETGDPPLHLVLGKDALEATRAKLDQMTKTIDAWAKVSESTDFPSG